METGADAKGCFLFFPGWARGEGGGRGSSKDHPTSCLRVGLWLGSSMASSAPALPPMGISEPANLGAKGQGQMANYSYLAIDSQGR